MLNEIRMYLQKIVQALLMGGHGEPMVHSTIYKLSGMPKHSFNFDERFRKIVTRAKKGGGELSLVLMGTSAGTHQAPAAAQMVEAILLDQNR